MSDDEEVTTHPSYGQVVVNVGSLDHPEAVEPRYHTWIGSRIAWFDTLDDLPRYPDDGPDAPPNPAPSSSAQET